MAPARPGPHGPERSGDSAARRQGIDRHPWALSEAAAATYRLFGIKSRTVRGDAATVDWPRSPAAFVAAFTLNELGDPDRDAVLSRLLDRRETMLIVEPLAGFVAPWWDRWRHAVEKAGGRADEWRFPGVSQLPEIVARLDRAAGLNHRELTGRSLYLAIRN